MILDKNGSFESLLLKADKISEDPLLIYCNKLPTRKAGG